MASVTADLSPAQRQVLLAVKKAGETTAADLAITLGISPAAVRQHLSALRAGGLVLAQRLRGQPGRPVDQYRGADLAEPLFEAPDGDLSTEILSIAAEEDPALVGRIFDRRRQLIVEDALARFGDAPAQERVGIVTSLLDEQGYVVDHEQIADGHFRINLRSCAIWTVANSFGQACASELDLIQTLIPEAAVERSATKKDGSHSCAYDIKVG